MKIGKQTPVHKGGDICVKNYRPITVCNSISKILEKIVRDRIMEYLMRIKLLNKSQFGFRPKHSTNHAIINLTETALDALEKGLKVGGVYLDISKAFDTVNHRILLRKLEYYGFRSTTLMWFESYLTNREQYVGIRKSCSDKYTLNWGIPQGGVLAPILFILFMNDIDESTNVFDFSMYADDTCLILGIKSLDYNETMKIELEKVVDWFSSNELLLNFDKTDYLHFGPHYNKTYIKGEYDLTELHCALPNYLFHDDNWEPGDPDHIELNKKGEYVMHELQKVCPQYMFKEHIEMPDNNVIYEPENVKYLGVYFDGKLTFKKHIDILCCKINRIVGTLWKSEHLNLEAKKMIYHGLVESHLNYAISAWGSVFSKNLTGTLMLDHVPENLKILVTTQNKVIRAIFRKRNYNKETKTHTSVTPLYKELGVLKLCDLYYYNLAIMAHDYFHSNVLPEKLSEKYTKKSDVTEVVTRCNEFELYYPTPRLSSTVRKPSVASSAVWNILPLEIRSVKSKNTFKAKLREYFIAKYNG